MTLDQIQIRDPFVVVENGLYYLFGSTDPDIWQAPGQGFQAYRSVDLVHFEGPFDAFVPPANFWGEKNFWAPEVHRYNGRYYMLATFWGRGTRGCQILSSDTILGPYREHSEGTITPADWLSLDATLYVEKGQPYAVFCHEWIQVGDGEMAVVPLSHDLKRATEKPQILFTATEAPWVTKLSDWGKEGYITDGPFLYTTSEGVLLMLWSSYREGRYAIGYARSSGGIRGPWTQCPQPLFEADGGHGMIFRTLEGELKLAIHSPNDSPRERAQFLSLRDTGKGLVSEG